MNHVNRSETSKSSDHALMPEEPRRPSLWKSNIESFGANQTEPILEPELTRFDAEAVSRSSRSSEFQTSSWSLDPDEIRSSYPMTTATMSLVVKLFQESSVDRLDRIRQALATGDRDEVLRNAHALKGSLGMFASARTLEIVSELELKVKQGQLNQVTSLFMTLEFAIASLQPTLDQLADNSDGSA
jgi:HPt (histidine-containing phosphotransfer) domain-containing protein